VTAANVAPPGLGTRRSPMALAQAGELDVSASSEMIVVREHGEAMAGDCERLGRDLAARMLSRGTARLMGTPGSVSAGAATTNRDDAHD
jgi:hypothetical protein